MELDPRDVDLLLFGPNSLASSWRYRALRQKLMNHPEVIAAGKKYGRKDPPHNPFRDNSN